MRERQEKGVDLLGHVDQIFKAYSPKVKIRNLHSESLILGCICPRAAEEVVPGDHAWIILQETEI